MKEIFEQYGGVLITVVAILSVIAVIIFVVGQGNSSVIGQAFIKIINSFVDNANKNAGINCKLM
ncbi:hypothetical protein [Lachnobacterium bovis]|uniref:Uncharacterized protein n=1 Tax=Lachnobacterium bovis DSM 14045 TaxID=1122142 RepID=A0A1H3JI48_9FIRM|nr:hypothetical protein [Lachnobacterium bovis]SDY39643.1 hypothetical protein SAMN02910414_01475 [Lachnobacterium bovis DSM 14045]